MTKPKRQKRNRIKIDYENPAKSPAGLARSKKIIRTEKAKEALFLELCKQIKLDDFRQERAEKQRNDRISKRLTKKQNKVD